MPVALIIALALHVLSGVFWAGTSFALARAAGAGARRLFRPQMGAAVVAFLSGGYLWGLTHRGAFGGAEKVLALGIVCAVIAAGVQGAMVGPAIRKFASGAVSEADAGDRIVLAQRIAAGLLAVTVLCMVSARYF